MCIRDRYILHFTIYTTFHRKATLKAALELLDYSFNNNTRVYQIHKESGVANRFLTARRHFWTPWSERTHCMENGQSVFFLSPHTPYERVRLARFARVRLLRHALLISLLILRKKKTVLQSTWSQASKDSNLAYSPNFFRLFVIRFFMFSVWI